MGDSTLINVARELLEVHANFTSVGNRQKTLVSTITQIKAEAGFELWGEGRLPQFTKNITYLSWRDAEVLSKEVAKITL